MWHLLFLEQFAKAYLQSCVGTQARLGYATFDVHRHHLRNRVEPLVTVRLPRSQHKDGATLSQLSTSGRLPQHIAHGVQQELTWMRTGSGVQLLRVHPAQMVYTCKRLVSCLLGNIQYGLHDCV